MRRAVDSVIFLLIAYTVSWPVVRTFVSPPPAEDPSTVAVQVLGEDVPSAAFEIRAAHDAATAQVSMPGWEGEVEFADGIAQLPEHLVVLVGRADCDTVSITLADGDRELQTTACSVSDGRFTYVVDPGHSGARAVLVRTAGAPPRRIDLAERRGIVAVDSPTN